MQKFKETLGSSNFLVSLLTMVISAVIVYFNAGGADLPPEFADQVVEAFNRMDLMQIITIIAPAVIKTVKTFAKNGFPNPFRIFMESSNFRTQLVSIVIGLFAIFGINLDGSIFAALLNSFLSVTEWSPAVIVSLLVGTLQLINSALHAAKPAKYIELKPRRAV